MRFQASPHPNPNLWYLLLTDVALRDFHMCVTKLNWVCQLHLSASIDQAVSVTLFFFWIAALSKNLFLYQQVAM